MEPEEKKISGLHHVTAIAGAAQPNVDFYAGTLGLRLVKRTVNFDDPGTYHLYYGDAAGRPGTILTFFPWANAVPGRSGSGMAGATAFAAPEGALSFWMDRLAEHGVAFTGPERRFGRQVLHLADPHGLPLELVFRPHLDEGGWGGGSVPAEHALRHFDAVTLDVSDTASVSALFTEVFGWEEAGAEDERTRLEAPSAGGRGGSAIDLVDTAQRGRAGAGTVHHVAFRADDDEAQAHWRERLLERGLRVTDVQDRQYFRSIYFRDRRHTGGVLFEIATDPPGFLLDEDEEALGTALKLPPWLEDRRAAIEAHLPALRIPSGDDGRPTADDRGS